MPASASPAIKPFAQPHVHLAGQMNCPYCDQQIPEEKFEEISGRIEARARAHVAEAVGVLREQYARERAQADVKAKTDVEQARKDAASEIAKAGAEAAGREAQLRHEMTALRAEGAAAIEALTSKAAEREKGIQEEAAKTAHEAVRDQLGVLEQQKAELDNARAALASQLETVRAENAAKVEKLTEEVAAAKSAHERALQEKLAETGQQMEALKEAHASEINAQREALEKDKLATVNAERANGLAVRMKLEEQLADMQRQLQQKTAHEHGEGDELDLFAVLKEFFEGDRIRRVEKGSPGADVIHEVVENGKVVGKIVYDRKNRGRWATEYATKLREDQIAEKADHAILSTNKFPKGKRELCVYEHVVLARPARVLALAEILRSEIVHHHALRVSNEEREAKTAELYAFITSPHCRQLLEAIETLVAQLEQIDADEQKTHTSVWQKRFRLLKAVLKSNGDLRFQIGRIVGTVDTTVPAS